MKPDNDIIMSALKFVCGENDHICRLCLCSTESREISIHDIVNVTRSYYNETISYLTMLNALGVPSDPDLPQVLCCNCATTTINCYVFQKLCVYSQEQWENTLCILDRSISQSNVLNTRIQSAYYIINNNENVILTSRKRLLLKTKKAALTKIKESLKSRLKYLEGKQRITDTICEECGECFNSSFSLARHIRIHSKTKCLCPECPKIFSTAYQLEEHTERVHYPKNIQCDICPKMFSMEKHLKIHKQLHHIAVSCESCCIKFPSRIELRSHLAKHNVNSCPQCKKKFLNKHSYKLHMKMCCCKDRTPKFLCDICNKSYVRKNGLRSHLKIDHGFGNVLLCNWCNKKFDAVSRLKNHIVKHTRERNFTCEQCGGKFVTHAALVYHTRLHTGERPFPCDMCEESFLSASRRMAHKRRKHLEPTLQCNICRVKFVTGHELRKHTQRHLNPHSKLYVKLSAMDLPKT